MRRFQFSLGFGLLCRKDLRPATLLRLALRCHQGELDTIHLRLVPTFEDDEFILGSHALHAPGLGLLLELIDLLCAGLLLLRELLNGRLKSRIHALGQGKKFVDEFVAHVHDANAVVAQVLLWSQLVPLVVLGEDHDLVVEQEVLDEGDLAIVVNVHIRQLGLALAAGPGLAETLQEGRGLDVVHGHIVLSGTRIRSVLAEGLEERRHVLPRVTQGKDERLEEELAHLVRMRRVNGLEARQHLGSLLRRRDHHLRCSLHPRFEG
mmetsp:Transcript_31691/g.92071  ORF Transcript_31691/g.92071 Transcript_31691/m.92071 type:complete len:264 (-) Transcript_31691:460-1251(-)